MIVFMNAFLSLFVHIAPCIMVAFGLKKLNLEKFVFIAEIFAVTTIMKVIITEYDKVFFNSFYYESQSYLVVIEIIMALFLIKLCCVTVFRKPK